MNDTSTSAAPATWTGDLDPAAGNLDRLPEYAQLAAIRDRDESLFGSRSAPGVAQQDRHALLRLLDAAIRDRDLAIAHDRQPYPTAWAYEQACKALNAAKAMNGVHERTIARLRGELEQARRAPGPTGLTRAWSGYDDDEFWFPTFANLADAKAYAEVAFRAQCAALETDDPGEISWKERAARTDATGYPGMFDLQSEVAGDGWVVCEVLVHPDLASGLREHPIVTDEPEPVAVEEYPGQGVLPVETAGSAK